MLRTNYALIAVFLAVVLSLSLQQMNFEASTSGSELSTYVYEFKLNASINYLATVSDDVVAIFGDLGGIPVIQFINISDPFIGPQAIFTYPLTGTLTSYAVDGYPTNYIAVGTDRGEVIAFSVVDGRLYEKLHYIQGADFVVNDIYLLRTSTTTKLLTLSVNRNNPSERYIYVFDINLKSVLRIGPLVGSLSTALEGITPHVVVPTKVVYDSGYYYSASQVFVAYTGLTTTLLINATYMFNNTLLPAGNSYIEIYVRNQSDHLLYTYQVNLEADGTTAVLVPLGYLIDVIVYDIYGNMYKRSINLTERIAVEVMTVNFTLSYPPDTRKALDGFPMTIKVFDFSKAPMTYEVITDIRVPNYRANELYVFRPLNFRLEEGGIERDPYIVVIEYFDFLNITYMYDDYRLSNTLLHDYLGYGGGDIVFVEVDANATYLIVALVDGRIKVYRHGESLTNQHLLEHEYVALGRPVNLKLSFIDGRPYYMLYSTGGLQLISLEPHQIPLFRLDNLLTFNFPEAVHADSLPDLSLIAMGGRNRLLLIKGLDTYLRNYGARPIDLNKIKIPSLTLSVVGPDGMGVPNSRVILRYGDIYKEYLTDNSGNVVITNVFPGEYLVSIHPQTHYLQQANISIYVPKLEQMIYKVILNYTLYELKLLMNDEFDEGPQVPLEIYINNTLIHSNYSMKYLSIRLPYGSYSLFVKPSRGYMYFYEPIIIPLTLDRDLTVNLTLFRRSYSVTVMVIDEVSKEPMYNVVAVIGDIMKHINASFTTTLKAGKHLVRILIPSELSDKYIDTELLIDVITDSSFAVNVRRRSYSVIFTLVDSLTNAPPIGYFNIHVNGSELLVGVDSTFSLTLPYGNYLITIKPQGPYDNVYMDRDVLLQLVSNKSLSVYLDRVRYRLTVRFYDPISKTPITPLRLYVNGSWYEIPERTQFYTILLPYGTYKVRAMPDVGFDDVYHEVDDVIVNLARDTMISLTLSRKHYNLSITIYDITSGPLLGLFDVEINGSLVNTSVSYRFSTSLPCDTYLVRVKPHPPYIPIYLDSEVYVRLFNHTSLNILMSRKYYMLTILVRDDRDLPLPGAEVTLIDTVSGTLVSKGITASDGKFSISIYYGSFRVIVRHGGFYDYISSIELTTSLTEKVMLSPSPLTIITRYIHLIIVISLIIVSIIVLIKIRNKVAERLLREEMF